MGLDYEYKEYSFDYYESDIEQLEDYNVYVIRGPNWISTYQDVIEPHFPDYNKLLPSYSGVKYVKGAMQIGIV